MTVLFLITLEQISWRHHHNYNRDDWVAFLSGIHRAIRISIEDRGSLAYLYGVTSRAFTAAEAKRPRIRCGPGPFSSGPTLEQHRQTETQAAR